MRYLYFLDYLRVFACLSVLVTHKFQGPIWEILSHQSLAPIPESINLFLQVVLLGTGAVIIFFLISGYVISHVLYNDSTVGFLIKRIFRLYPLYIFAVLLQYSLLKVHNPDYTIVLFDFVMQLLLLGDFFATPYALAGVEWTLRIELIFYIFMILAKSWMPKGFKPTGFPVLLLIILFFALITPTFIMPHLQNSMLLVFLPFPLLGCAFYLYEIQKINLLVFLAFLALVLFSFYFNGIELTGTNKDLIIYFGILGVGVFALAWHFREKFAASKLILILSPLTYSVYLLHFWLLDYFHMLSGSMWISLTGLLLVCYIVHQFIEKPMFELGKKLVKKASSYTIKNSVTAVKE